VRPLRKFGEREVLLVDANSLEIRQGNVIVCYFFFKAMQDDTFLNDLLSKLKQRLKQHGVYPIGYNGAQSSVFYS